ncbi:hypothetical protein CSB45_06145 [candidate division KSB3 bacterium]|uniref:Large ribosomal subunit protein bL12 C-terminal domain-containing protein n=1 Tax=candidate division KSB3 bacterium TaxID=2044937 RepID=A0A2G6E7R1_9BACT|nr:MAG: hypothetical protein CSB45_06145 [candidate division KSB3 bacterium]PIE30226.1 MAG: hypothetical protein CSA57_04860 [candidate division KSB3 bacterium]
MPQLETLSSPCDLVLMKKLSTHIVLYLIVLILSYSSEVSAREILKITRDHFEFRNAPQASDDTFISTLRVDTPVEWTGKISGKWFEVKAPSGLVGWVHSSGLSNPKTPVPRPQKTIAPSSVVRRPSSSAQVSKLKASVKTLKKTNAQYEAKLKEQDRRLQESSERIGELEEKLSDADQRLNDQEQLCTLHERKADEAEQRVLVLEETIKEKDDALMSAKVETTRLHNELQNIRTEHSALLSPERLLLLLSLFVNALGFIFFLAMRKRPAAGKGAAPMLIREDVKHSDQETEDTDRREEVISGKDEGLELDSQGHALENDDQMKELDVVMTSSHAEGRISEDAGSDEVEIDLGDVLPAASAGVTTVHTGSSDNDNSYAKLDPLPAVPEEREQGLVHEESVEEIISQHTDGESILDDEPLIVGGSLLDEDRLECSEESEHVEELLEDSDETLEEIEKLVQEDPELVEGFGDDAELPEEGLQAVEISGESFEQLPKSETQLIESEEEDEGLFEDLPENFHLEEDGPGEEHVEEKCEDEDEDELVLEIPGIVDEEEYEHGMGGFETVSETDLAEFEAEKLPDDYSWDADDVTADVAEEVPDIDGFQEETHESASINADDPQLEEFTDNLGEAASQSVEVMVAGEVDDEEPYDFSETLEMDLEAFKVEETVPVDDQDHAISKALHDDREEINIEKDDLDIFSELEKLPESDAEDVSAALLDQDAPSFLEPSPFLIEPEHEPEEPSVPVERDAREQGYAIELQDAGHNKEHVIHVLSKVNGLLAGPEELVESVPCIIAKGAGKSDAENFRVIMEKLGAKIRLFPES